MAGVEEGAVILAIQIFLLVALCVAFWNVSTYRRLKRELKALEAELFQMQHPPKPTVNDLLKQQWKATGKK